MKNEFQLDAAICTQMMLWRKATLVFAIPFVISLLASFTWGRLREVGAYTQALLCIAFIPQPPMLYYLFRLANKMHGRVYAVLHVVLTLILTPFFLVGPLFIPLLVSGDARRLLMNDDVTK